ncbi:thyrotropin-releasing hormone-degrading ectoenzyme-like [Odontomachus brunneus]|uniref:thyrotropin-releasing hormone-degrading ectoenzyme-like n=1 Tax=Odontomachus brunneus TaxID=486640 RepID=UPI0013F2A5B3|nr:thyrotropin-releasing hormone-degrading ectoenzyme-like [Odontomachus brunneus]
MGTIYFKLFIVLMFAVAMSNSGRDILDCPNIIGPLSLPEISPLRYNIRLTIKPLMKIILGEVDIMFNLNDSPLQKFSRSQTPPNKKYEKGLYGLSLYARGLKPNIKQTVISRINSTMGKLVNIKTYKLANFTYCDEILNLIFEDNLLDGRYSLHMKYTSNLHTNEKIFYPYIWTEDANKWLFTNLYTRNGTRSLFPCWDDPILKTTYNVSVKYPTDYMVFFTQPARRISFDEFGTQWSHYEDFSSVQTYSLAIALVNGVTKSYEKHGIHYMWSQPKVKKAFTYAYQIADQSMSYLIQKFQMHIESEFQKIDHIILPNSPLKSMGGFGLAIYREEDVTYDKDTDLPSRTIDIAKLITYEMARQIFVNLVGRHKQNERLINELLASFYSYYAVDQMRKNDRLMELFTVQMMHPAIETDNFEQRKVIKCESKDRTEIDTLFYCLMHHKKGFILFRMLLNIFTPEVFEDIIKKYVWTRNENLWDMMDLMSPPEKHGNLKIKEIIDSWLTPTYHYEVYVQMFRKQKLAKVHFKTVRPETLADKVKVPITVILQSNLKYYNNRSYNMAMNTHWMKYPSSIDTWIPDNDEFILLNLEQLAYVRVQYPVDNWINIANYLQLGNYTYIPPLNRAQLINDAFYLTLIGELNEGDVFFNIIAYFNNEEDYIVWYPMFRIMTYTSEYIKLWEGRRLKARYQSILETLLEKVGYELKPEYDGMRMSLILLGRKWACQVGNIVCTDLASVSLMEYMENKTLNRVPRISKQWVLCSGLVGVNQTIFNDVMEAAVKTYRSMEILEYLSCSENHEIIINYLKLILQQHYFADTIQPMGQIFRTIIKKHVKNDFVLHFVTKNYNQILDRFPVVFRSGILLSDMIMNIYRREQLERIKDFAYTKYHWNSNTLQATSFNKLLYYREKYISKLENKFKPFFNIYYY